MQLVGFQAGIGIDAVGVDAGGLADPLDQRRQFQRLAEGDQLPGVEIADAGGGKRRLAVDVAVERHQPLRHPRLVGEFDQRLAALRLLDLLGPGEQGFEIAIVLDQRRRGLDADAGDARHVVGGVADQRLDVGDLLRRHAEIVDDAVDIELALGTVAGAALDAGFEVVEQDLVGDHLHQVLVGRDDQDVGAGLLRLDRIGGDQVVGLEAGLFDRLEAEGGDRLAHQGKLRDQVVGRLAAGALVVGVDLLAEGVFRLVEEDGEVGRHDADGALADELVELGREQAERPGRQAVRAVVVLGVLVNRLEIGTEDEGRAVDQKDVVAGSDGLAGW